MNSFGEEEKRQMCSEIAEFFRQEHDLELGIIGTGNILDFFQDMLGKRIYNKALDDAKRFYEMREIWNLIIMRCTRNWGDGESTDRKRRMG